MRMRGQKFWSEMYLLLLAVEPEAAPVTTGVFVGGGTTRVEENCL